ncbi:MAG: MogA/MoaB family molybdenum cofactor biosynthesis protein [Candidatus Methanomethylicaceae archaeon]
MSYYPNLQTPLKFLIIITSDTIASKISKGEPYEDASGELAIEIIKRSGNIPVGRIYLPNDPVAIRERVMAAVNQAVADVIVISGGTGLGPRDVTIEAITPLFEKLIPGFGELFRRLSYDIIGTSAIASRAVAGLIDHVLLFALPGSPDAVRMALESIIIKESPHLVKMIYGHRHSSDR